MNIMRKIFLTVLLVAFASAAFAEGTPKKPSVAGFVSNGFWDNWEVSAGFGTGTAFSNGGNSGSWGDRFGFEGNLSVTKWVHPVFGMRAQLQGGWFNNFDSQIGKMTWPYMFGHLDFMVNASNWIGGYRTDRAWYAVPFAGFGYMASNFTDRSQRENASGSRQEFAFTAGLLSKFRLSPAFDFNIELKGLLTKSGICPAEMNGSYLAGLSALEAARSENADLANRLKAAEAEADAAKAAAAAAAAKAAAEAAAAQKVNTLSPTSIIFYDYSMSKLTPKEKTRLELMADLIKSGPKDRVYKIEGHADQQTGTAAGNKRVAENRAKSVYDFLVKCGVNPKQLTYEGKGNAANVYENNQKANRAVIIK